MGESPSRVRGKRNVSQGNVLQKLDRSSWVGLVELQTYCQLGYVSVPFRVIVVARLIPSIASE